MRVPSLRPTLDPWLPFAGACSGEAPMFWIGLIIGVLIGMIAGIFVAALMSGGS